MNQWQPMIDRCRQLSERFDATLILRTEHQRTDFVPMLTFDDVETILFAVNYTANNLGAMKGGTDALRLSEHNKFNPQTELPRNYSTETICDWSDGNKENPADWANEK